MPFLSEVPWGRLDEILEFLRFKGTEKREGEKESGFAMRLVMTAVTLETVGSGLKKLEKFGFEDVQVVQIAAARGEKAGKYHLLKAQSPVFILSGELRL